MARKKGQTYTPEQKAKVVLELLKEEKTLGELATQYKVTPKTIQNWKKEFLANASKAFESDNNAKENKEKGYVRIKGWSIPEKCYSKI